MASPSAILAAAKAVPGAGRPTPPPQGSMPWIGQLPLQSSTQPQAGYSPGYGPFLPRPPETFTSGAFGPFSPILPVPVDQPPPGALRPQPRRWIYRPGYDLPVGEPGSDGYKLVSFPILKTLADTYSILRTCLEIRKNEIRALDWDIVLTPDAAKAYRGDRAAMRDFGERQAKAKKWFRKPDPNYFTFSSWLHAMMDQVFTYDALSLYLCPTMARGRTKGDGLLGSGLDALWLIDGASVRPLVGLHGEIPRPPAPGYEQYAYGVPRSDYMTMFDGRDLRDAGFTRDDLRGDFRGDQLLYLPYLARADSPYGFSLVEQAVIPIMTGLRKQAFQLSYFDESTIPSVYISPGDVNMTATQIRELQDALNAIAGDINWRYKVIVLPPGSKTMPQKDIEIVDQADEWIATEVAMVANINPMEIGILPKISTVASPFAAREMAQAQRSIHERTATRPTLKYVTEIMDMILQVVCGQDDMRFMFSGMEEDADLAAQTDMGIKQIQVGGLSIDEFRDETGRVPWGLPETSEPIIVTPAGPIPLAVASQLAQANLAQTLAGPAAGATDTGAHHAAQGAMGGTRNGSATPAGASGTRRMNGPVTQRQARRGGALAPAHATAEGAPGHSGGPPSKAAGAEFEALARHLRKGRAITAWQPRHIPGHALAVISEDLAKGLTADQAVGIAAAMVLGGADFQWTGKASQSQAQSRQQQMTALARQYAPRISAALSGLARAILKLVRAWMAGTLAVTAGVLASMIRDLVRDALASILPELWRDAWHLGPGTGDDGDLDLQALLAQLGIGMVSAIADTRITDVMALVRQAAREHWTAKELAARIRALLDFPGRAEMIARSETARAVMAAVLRNLRDTGTAYVRWRVHSDDPCQKCVKASQSPPLPLGTPFPGVNLPAPLAHPRCQCDLEKAEPPKIPVTAKARRRVALNGEQFLAAFAGDDEGNAAGGGARGVMPHLADGTQVPGGSPGISAGGEPPRWDASEPRPGDRWIDGAHDDEQGGERDSGTPVASWPSPHYMDGHWPQGGHGTQQSPMSSPGGATGRSPNSAGKSAQAAAFLAGAPKAEASAVFAQLEANYPPGSIAWVKRAAWHGPSEVPLPLIDWSGRKTWAADHETSRVDEFARQLRAREHVSPVVAVAEPGKRRLRLIDGHHRALACKDLGWPVRAYVAEVSGKDAAEAFETHASQVHQGGDPANKSFTAGAGVSPGAVSGLAPFNLLGQRDRSREDFAGRVMERLHAMDKTGPHVAGLMVRAADTGRVLMLQRSLDDDQDWAAGMWEPPGGHAEPGETLLQAALREWAEETGHPVPRGSLTGTWDASNGIYRGYVLTVPSEDSVDIFGGRDQVWDPDDPKGDHTQAVAWWDPAQFADNPSIRPEMAADLPRVLEALSASAAKSAQTPVVSTVHHPLGHEGLWHTPSEKVPGMQQLPAYHQNTARALMRDQGMDESRAIATAISAIREWRAGRAFGGQVKVTPQVQAAAAAADAEFEQLRAAHH